MGISAGSVVLMIMLLLGDTFGVPTSDSSMVEYIRKHNYPIESHTIETQDGYILRAQRIPHGLDNKKAKNVVLLVHGLGGSAENFILLGPPDALAFYLADRGYDVWFFNARGTLHSRKHRSLNPNRDRKKFWNFSWHEIGVRDLPATINYILNVTGEEKLFYVGHSQGTTVFFVMLAELPEMNDKIRAAGLMAPSLYLNYMRSPIVLVGTKLLPLGQSLLSFLNWHELPMPNSPMMRSMLQNLCLPEAMQGVCLDVVYLIGGLESGLINKTVLPTVLRFSPSGFSVRQPWHFAQVIISGEFKQYDFGKKKNLRLYKSAKSPLYNVSNVKAPLAIFYGAEDPFSNPRMNEELAKNVPNIILKYEMPVAAWNHLDYLLAYNVKEILHDPLLEAFGPFENANEL